MARPGNSWTLLHGEWFTSIAKSEVKGNYCPIRGLGMPTCSGEIQLPVTVCLSLVLCRTLSVELRTHCTSTCCDQANEWIKESRDVSCRPYLGMPVDGVSWRSMLPVCSPWSVHLQAGTLAGLQWRNSHGTVHGANINIIGFPPLLWRLLVEQYTVNCLWYVPLPLVRIDPGRWRQ